MDETLDIKENSVVGKGPPGFRWCLHCEVGWNSSSAVCWVCEMLTPLLPTNPFVANQSLFPDSVQRSIDRQALTHYQDSERRAAVQDEMWDHFF